METARKAHASKNSFVAQLVASGHMPAAELAFQIAQIFRTPLLDLDTIDPQRLPRDLLDAKLCQAYRIVVLGKRSNRLIVATADPTDQQASDKIKFTAQMGVDWVVAEYDKLSRLVEAAATSVSDAVDSMVGADFEFDDLSTPESAEVSEQAIAEVEDAPIVRFLHKVLIDAFKGSKVGV